MKPADELATEAAISRIQQMCAVMDVPGGWYDPTRCHEDDRDAVAISVKYLDSRGRITRNAKGWIRMNARETA